MAIFRFDYLVVAGRALACTVLMSTYVWSLNAQINPEAFRRTIDGSPVDLYTLKNKKRARSDNHQLWWHCRFAHCA